MLTTIANPDSSPKSAETRFQLDSRILRETVFGLESERFRFGNSRNVRCHFARTNHFEHRLDSFCRQCGKLLCFLGDSSQCSCAHQWCMIPMEARRAFNENCLSVRYDVTVVAVVWHPARYPARHDGIHGKTQAVPTNQFSSNLSGNFRIRNSISNGGIFLR